MTTTLEPYSSYKPSGVEWLGDVPNHWGVSPIKRYSKCRSGEALSSVDISPISDAGRSTPVIGGNGQMGFAKTQNCSGPVLAIGRVGALCGNVHFIGGHAWITDNALVLSANSDLVSVKYLAITLSARNLNETANKTAQPLITGTGVLNERVPLPPLREQRAIARYLDYMDSRIQRYIKAKERLIELLEEQKRAVINHAVTRGLDPDVPLKSSGVEWLGDVPAHWEVRRLKHTATVIMGQSPSSDDCSDEPIGPPFLQGCAEFGKEHPQPVQYCRQPPKLSPEGAILLSVRAPVGRLNRADQQYGIGRGLCAIVPDTSRVLLRLTKYQLEAFEGGLRLEATGSTYESVSVGDVGNHAALIPPIEEQSMIVRYLDDLTSNIETALSRAIYQIELIGEYRTRLIADVVTGKLDVRDAAANLPDDLDDEAGTDRANAVHYSGTEA